MTAESTAGVERAREYVRRAHAINPSPSLLRVEERLRSGDASARQLALLIEGSPALAARVLRMANSGFYSPVEPVVSLSRAVAMLGDTVLRQLVLTSLIASRRAGTRSPRQALAMARLMADAVRSAVISRDLSVATRSQDPDSAFAAGLLHDLGHVYLLDELGDAYAEILLGPEEDPSLERERELAGTTHQEVGAVFAYEWNLPALVSHVLWDHHLPQVGTLSYLVHVADRLVREVSRPMAAESDVAQAQADIALASLQLNRERWNERLPGVRRQIEELLTLFDSTAS